MDGPKAEPLEQNPEAIFERAAADLAARAPAAVAEWIERSVVQRSVQFHGELVDGAAERAREAGEAATDAVAGPLRDALSRTPGSGGPTPLQVVRSVVVHASAALDDLGVPGVVRDQRQVHTFPDDEHGLVPGSWADISGDLADSGIRWSAAAAAVVISARERGPR